MAKYRIIRRAGYVEPTKAVYDVERRELWWWDKVGIAYLSIESAKARIQELQEADANPIKPAIVHQAP